MTCAYYHIDYCSNEDEADLDNCGPDCPGYFDRETALGWVGDDKCHAQREGD